MKFSLFLALIVCVLLGCSEEDPFVEDLEGNQYQIKKYGDYIWMTENLRTKKANNGDEITYYLPDDSAKNVANYGLLYDYETACKVCPDGWMLPSIEDWEKLFGTLKSTAHNFKDTDFWSGELNTNASQFSVRPAGYGNTQDDNFFQKKSILWAKTKNREAFAWAFIFEKGNINIRKAEQHFNYAFSVRCVKKSNDLSQNQAD